MVDGEDRTADGNEENEEAAGEEADLDRGKRRLPGLEGRDLQPVHRFLPVTSLEFLTNNVLHLRKYVAQGPRTCQKK